MKRSYNPLWPRLKRSVIEAFRCSTFAIDAFIEKQHVLRAQLRERSRRLACGKPGSSRKEGKVQD
uniref:Uncharacterized protein n=1 Tax=Eiseniibacteriota bacterium TaxID=2212470 RepID=A0A832I100_UNCEI